MFFSLVVQESGAKFGRPVIKRLLSWTCIRELTTNHSFNPRPSFACRTHLTLTGSTRLRPRWSGRRPGGGAPGGDVRSDTAAPAAKALAEAAAVPVWVPLNQPLVRLPPPHLRRGPARKTIWTSGMMRGMQRTTTMVMPAASPRRPWHLLPFPLGQEVELLSVGPVQAAVADPR